MSLRMSLKTFIQLNEGEYANKATLIYQAFIDNLESAHYNRDESILSFNVGKATKISKFSDLELVLRQSHSTNIQLGKRNSTGNFAVVIDLRELPAIPELEKVLEKPEVMRPAVAAIENYLTMSKGSPKKEYMTDYEKTKHFNNREIFEETYQKLITKLQEKKRELAKLISNFEEQKKQTENSSRRVTLDMAIDKLKADYLGKTAKEFLSKAYKLLDELEPDFRNNLDKDKKKILEDRLKQFYEEVA